jgi:hypothetical protein
MSGSKRFTKDGTACRARIEAKEELRFSGGRKARGLRQATPLQKHQAREKASADSADRRGTRSGIKTDQNVVSAEL